MCPSCRSKKEIDRALRNERSGNDPLQKEVMKIRRYLISIRGSDYFYNKFYEFDKQLSYYTSKLNQKEIYLNAPKDQYDKELPKISSKEDIIQWCKNYYKKTKEEIKEWRKK